MKLVLILIAFVTRIECRSKYIITKNEIPSTKTIIMNRNPCTEHELPIFIHSAAINFGIYYKRRQMIRETWLKDAQKHNISVTFVMGDPNNYSVQKALQEENSKYRDILQFGFIDSYSNNTLKAISLARWMSHNCVVGHFVIKIDDDVLVNVKRLMKLIDLKSFKSGLTGRLFSKLGVFRDPKGKWY